MAKHLTFQERGFLYLLKKKGKSNTAIAELMGRDRSTIYRSRKRFRGHLERNELMRMWPAVAHGWKDRRNVMLRSTQQSGDEVRADQDIEQSFTALAQ